MLDYRVKKDVVITMDDFLSIIYFIYRVKKDVVVTMHNFLILIIFYRVKKDVVITMDDFSPIALLGRGHFGKVLLAEHKNTGNIWIV